MWILLLDHSGSMGEPFSGNAEPRSRRVRETSASVKLDAAKDVLLSETERLEPDFPLIIFAFTEQVARVYEGRAGDRQKIRAALDQIRPDDGTDIAAALDAAAATDVNTPGVLVPRIFLISDGKSDRTQAKRAARRCVFERSMGIHFILIDPTEDGEMFVREVVEPLGGTWDTVTSRGGLEDAARKAAEQYSQELARAEAWAGRSEQEAAEVEAAAADKQAVEFTAAYAGRMRPYTDYPLLVFAHLASMRADVERRLQDLGALFGEAPRRSEAESTHRIPLGTMLEITPSITGMSVAPVRQTVAWVGELEEVRFRLTYKQTAEPPVPCSGFVDVSASGLVIARIPVAIAIDGQTQQLAVEHSTAEMIRRVFASYSRKDEAIVRACKAAYRALAIQLFVDKDDLLTGQQWRTVVRQRIADHQLFQLYWSASAAESSEVANEWQIALDIMPQRSADFIQPVFWSKPMVSPPQQLSHLNFGFLDISSFEITAAPPIATTPTRPVEASDLRTAVCVLPIADHNPADTDRLRQDLARIVPWIEDLVGVRYYPPATFLVDEHAVRTVKAVSVPQESDELSDVGSEARFAIGLLQSLALAFHVGKLVEDDTRYDERHVFFEAIDDASKADYQHVTQKAEYVFSGPVSEFLSGKDVFSRAHESLEDILKRVERDDHGSSWDAARLLEELKSAASLSERAVIERLVTPADLDNLRSFERGRSSAAAAKLLRTEVPQLAKKYGVELFMGQTGPTRLRHCQSYPEYVRSYCNLWLNFVDVAVRKRGNVIVSIGYSATEDSLAWLERKLAHIHIVRHPKQAWQKEQEVLYEMSLLDYRDAVAFLSDVLHRVLQSGPQQAVQYVSAVAQTYGVFLPADAAAAQQQLEATLSRTGWPPQAAMPGQDKVLVCLRALQRIRERLSESGRSPNEADDLAHRLAVSVLVHEHFHSAVARGLDGRGRASLGATRGDAWNKATALNESLAEWTGRHYFRGDSEVLGHIDAHIHQGVYPHWPYAGAAFVEAEFVRGGLPAVRRWMQYLRDDPENAQLEFDHRQTEGVRVAGQGER